MSNSIDKETFVQVSKFLMTNATDKEIVEVSDDLKIYQFFYKDLMFACERVDGKIKPSYIEFQCCNETIQLLPDNNYRQEVFTLPNDENDENDLYQLMIVEDPTIINIFTSYLLWRFKVLLKTKF